MCQPIHKCVKFEENHNRRRADSNVSNTSSRRSSSNNSTLLLHDQNTYNYGVVPTSHPSQHMPSIIWTLFLMFKFDVITAMFVKLLSDILLFCNPMLLKLLLEFTEQLERPMWQGVVLAFTMFGSAELSSILISHFLCLMYRTLRLSNAARREKTVGEIVNLMAIDIDRFQQITPQTMQHWSNPFQFGFVLFLLFQQLVVSVFSGVAVMVLLFPINFVITMIIRKWQISQMYYKDERTKMMN
ncbi:unnamed protein product [Caenorhabditis sp. 36 PRJEB53466]|nr:unnamed protein product [Caenorhabditis sp. 36 PRJEB53466]